MVIGIVACHRAPEAQPWPARELGDFSYRIGATPVYGKFTIQADTVTLDAQQQTCRRVGAATRNSAVHAFRCVGGSMAFNVNVNSMRPLQSTWNTATPVRKTVEICTKYGTTTSGQRECTSSRTEVKTDTVRNGGLLEVTRIASADKP
jgi:hypothetical protein